MRKRQALILFSCSLVFASCHASNPEGNSQSSLKQPENKEYRFLENITYQDNNVIFTFPEDTENIKVYSSKAKEGPFEEISFLENENSYYADDALAYYRFEVTSGDKKNVYGPYSYLRDYFQNDYVHVYSPSDPIEEIQEEFDQAYSKFNTFAYQFSDERFCTLFLKGEYSGLDCPLGYYSTLQGLDQNPDSVSISSIYRDSQGKPGPGATCNFWCGAENVQVQNESTFAVSQATYLRRMHFRSNLNLDDGGYSSGGFIADSYFDKNIQNTTQQQWFTRNSEFQKWTKSDINMVFLGDKGNIPNSYPNPRNTVIEKTPIVKERPFLVFDENRGYGIQVSSLKEDFRGISWKDDDSSFRSIDEFYIAHPQKDNSESLNKAIKEKKSVLFTPGIYNIDSPLLVEEENTMLLGFGMATLRSTERNKDTILQVKDREDISISNLLLDAGGKLENLLRIKKDTDRKKGGYIFLSDLFFRIGGVKKMTTSVDIALRIEADDVIGDNFWVWRADHGSGVGWEGENSNYSRNGVVVDGDRVHLYGLMVEHFGEYQTIWNGDDGYMVFYQSETPYDNPTQDCWRRKDTDDEEDQGYASYKVSEKVNRHEAYGLGVYYVHHASTDGKDIILDHAIEAEAKEGINLYHMAIANFMRTGNSGIRHIINQYGKGNLGNGNKNSLTSFVDGKVTL